MRTAMLNWQKACRVFLAAVVVGFAGLAWSAYCGWGVRAEANELRAEIARQAYQAKVKTVVFARRLAAPVLGPEWEKNPAEAPAVEPGDEISLILTLLRTWAAKAGPQPSTSEQTAEALRRTPYATIMEVDGWCTSVGSLQWRPMKTALDIAEVRQQLHEFVSGVNAAILTVGG